MAMQLRAPIRVPSYTTDDLRRFPRDGVRYELLDGMLLVTPGPGVPHQVVLSRLHHLLSTYLAPIGSALVTSPGEIEVKPKILLDPDLLVFPLPRWLNTPWTRIRGWWLAVEVSGRASRVYDRDLGARHGSAEGIRGTHLMAW